MLPTSKGTGNKAPKMPSKLSTTQAMSGTTAAANSKMSAAAAAASATAAVSALFASKQQQQQQVGFVMRMGTPTRDAHSGAGVLERQQQQQAVGEQMPEIVKGPAQAGSEQGDAAASTRSSAAARAVTLHTHCDMSYSEDG